MARFAALAVCLAFVTSAIARPQPLTKRVVIETDPFTVTVGLPEGWTVEEGRVITPNVPSVCEVHRHYVHDNWNTALPAVMRDSAPAFRELMKIGGRVAVEYRTSAGARTTRSVYINLDELQPSTFVVWSVDANNTSDGIQCQVDFSSMVQSVRIDK